MMSYLNFDLNIMNYTLNELKTLIKLPETYNYQHIKNNINSITDKIVDLQLKEKDNREFMNFLTNINFILKSDLEEKENILLKENIKNLQNNQDFLKDQLLDIKKMKIGKKHLKKKND